MRAAAPQTAVVGGPLELELKLELQFRVSVRVSVSCRWWSGKRESRERHSMQHLRAHAAMQQLAIGL